MGRITVSQDVKSASGSFPLWAPGRYQLSIVDIEETKTQTGKAMLVVQHTAMQDITDVDGAVVEGKSAGRVYNRVLVDPVTAKNGGQISFLRPLVEAAGLPWSDFDWEDLIGKEVSATVTVEEYTKKDGTPGKKNAIGRYIVGK